MPSGSIILFTIRRRKKINDWLSMHGKRIKADIVSIELNYGTTRNNVHPYMIICNWSDPQTNEQYTFVSGEDIWEDPTSYIPADQKITVLIDPDGPKKRYKMDLSFLSQPIVDELN